MDITYLPWAIVSYVYQIAIFVQMQFHAVSVQLVITYQTIAYVMAVQIYAHNVNTIQYIRDLNVLFV